MTTLSVTPESGESNAYGKTVSQLQTGVTVSPGKISGTLHYVKEYKQFNPTVSAEQEGNYLALKIEFDDDTTVKFDLVGGDKGEVTMPKGDHLMVCRIKDKNTQSIRITAEKAGSRRNVKTYSLNGLTLETGDP